MSYDSLPDFEPRTKTFDGKSRTVYYAGDGPAVVVMSEIPGITPSVADFARRVVAAGFTVVMPHLFGEPGKPPSPAYIAQSIAGVCVSREFLLLARRQASPITGWLRALCRDAHAECGGPGVGAVGMCVTGGFALALAVDDTIMAPVLSQPSLPLPLAPGRSDALGVSDADLEIVRGRVESDGLCVLGLRFTKDALVPGGRFERLRAELGDGFVGVEIDSGPGNAGGYSRIAHSVLGEEWSDDPASPTNEADRKVIDHLRRFLVTTSSG